MSWLLPGWILPGRAQQPFFAGTLPVGITRGGESWLAKTATDAHGNVYVSGHFMGTLDFGSQKVANLNGQRDIFVAKYDAGGNFLWAARTTGNGGPSVRDLVVDADGNAYVTGSFYSQVTMGTYTLNAGSGTPNNDVYVAKLDAGGTWQWATSGGGEGDDSGAALALTSANQLLVGGNFTSSTATFGTSRLLNALPTTTYRTQDIFIARLSLAGSWLRAFATGGANDDQLLDLATDAAGNAYACGSYKSSLLTFGSTSLSNAGSASGAPDAFVAKLAPADTWQWAASIGGPGSEVLQGVSVDGAGRPYVTGEFSSGTISCGATVLANSAPGSDDMLVAALDAAGNWRWATAAGGAENDIGMSVAVSPGGQATITGGMNSPSVSFGGTIVTRSSVSGNSEAFVARLDASGQWQWALAPSGRGEKTGNSVFLAADGSAYVAGSYWEQAAFGPTMLAGNAAFSNIFLTQIYDNLAAAAIAMIAPTSGSAGQLVMLTGTGFVGVTSVLFNATPAAAFTVRSSTLLEATVPAGFTAGPISVHTGAGTATSTTSFQPVVLASALALANTTGLWPNPVGNTELLHLSIPASAVAMTHVTVSTLLGQAVRQATFAGGTSLELPMQGLAPGMYYVRLVAAGQKPLSYKLEVIN